MATNTGIIFGVVTAGGSGVPGAELTLNFIFGDGSAQIATGTSADTGGNLLGYPKATTNKDGKFVMPFQWSGVDIAKVVDGTVTASIYVAQWYADNSHRYTNTRCKLFLGLDLKKLIQVGFTDPTGSASDFVNCGKDFYASYRDMLPSHGVFPTVMPLSTEVWGLLGKATAQLP
ncbi:hypothetical protein [Reyranella sp. CPCC 100927]|uniref:hypothetical protein n=1 Tax=Reyranella sp. CPCC 100927 TaxID=2599616 RepID=UPI0011B6E68D|nr:hypothetical protein [Reyranella sp. CPCC 100927]TWS97553.1 hypothetical protein FQU96_37110 [Reyranella sp. CPCC 100927]